MTDSIETRLIRSMQQAVAIAKQDTLWADLAYFRAIASQLDPHRRKKIERLCAEFEHMHRTLYPEQHEGPDKPAP